MFYPPKGRLLADSKGVHLFLLMFYPPKGRLLADSCRGPIVFTYVLFWVSKSLEAFKFTDGFLLKNSWKCFIPRRGPIVFTYVL